jgi:hypothetical protein
MRGCLLAGVWISVALALMIVWNSSKGDATRTYIESGQVCTEYVSGDVSCEVLP